MNSDTGVPSADLERDALLLANAAYEAAKTIEQLTAERDALKQSERNAWEQVDNLRRRMHIPACVDIPALNAGARRRSAEAEAELDAYKQSHAVVKTRAEKAEAERDALLQDAKRYRWLRAHSWLQATTNYVEFGAGFNQTRPDILDAAIDAALSSPTAGEK